LYGEVVKVFDSDSVGEDELLPIRVGVFRLKKGLYADAHVVCDKGVHGSNVKFRSGQGRFRQCFPLVVACLPKHH